MNLFPNLQTLINELNFFVETPEEKEGKLILTLKHEVMSNPDKYHAFVKFFNPLKKKLRLEAYIEQKFVIKPTRVPTIAYALPLCQRIEFHIDITALHTDRLKDFFQHGTTKADVTESMGFLLNNGWSEKEFQVEIGLSRSTFFRYLPKNGANTPQQTAQ